MIKEQTFIFPFQGKDWGSKFLIGSLLLLASYIIPIIPLIFVLGYVLRGMEYTIKTGDKRLMEWDDWTDLGVKGIFYLLVHFIYLLPGLVLVAGGITFAGISILLSNSDGGGVMTLPFIFLGKLSLIFAIIVSIAAVVVLIIGSLMAPVAIARLAATGELSKALEISRIWAIIRSQIGDFLLVWGLTIGLGYVASIIYGVLYYTVCCCILIPILSAPISLYLILFGMTLFAQVYRQGESVTSDETLFLPDKTISGELTSGETLTKSEVTEREETDSGSEEPEGKSVSSGDLGQTSKVNSYELSLSELDLPARAERTLMENGFVTIGQIMRALEKDEEELTSIKGFGAKSLEDLKNSLRAKGFLD